MEPAVSAETPQLAGQPTIVTLANSWNLFVFEPMIVAATAGGAR
jgi:hypothetical protein